MDEETSPQRKTRQFAWLRLVGNSAIALAEATGAAAVAEAKQPPDPAPAPRRTDTAKAFMAAAAAVRHIIALELRVEAAGAGARKPAYRVPPPPDPRRPLLTHVLHDAVRNDPNRARRRRDIDACIEEEIQADPDGAQPIAQTAFVICTKLHIDVDLSRVPDAFLEFNEPIKTLSRRRIREDAS